uniref:E3 ubiquitin-protein ligase KCMF1 n=1 Tax=Glossina pallidipes TaxID=7398 RepID=A0A1A9ZLM2_GLOPL
MEHYSNLLEVISALICEFEIDFQLARLLLGFSVSLTIFPLKKENHIKNDILALRGIVDCLLTKEIIRRHEGISCDSCLKSNFNGRRYKCLICYDYDLCAVCYEEGVTPTRHLDDHPMQCILTRFDIELFFGGEMLNSEQPQSFTCPYCKKTCFSDASLLEHVSAEHTETSLEVVCPVCAGLPGGESNLVRDDFAGHLSPVHRTGPRELILFLDEPSAIRHGGGVRRIFGRTMGGVPRARRSNMHFSLSSDLSALSPPGRESVDPIAELLPQLSGVRRGGPPTPPL